MPLGMSTTPVLDDFWYNNTRRRVAYDFPQGTAPLTALLSLMEPEETPIQEFGWQEERDSMIKTQTTDTGQPSAGVVFYGAGTTTTSGAPTTITVGLQLRAYIDDASEFQIDDTIMFVNLDLTSGTGNLLGRVIAKNSVTAPYWIEFEVTATVASTVLNSSSANEDKWMYLTGSAFAEGSRSRTGRNRYPTTITNYTQIHKNAFELTRNALKTPTTYNKSGHYMKALKDNGIDHLKGLEMSLLWGKRRKTTDSDQDNGSSVARYFSGGLMWFLEQWEIGNVTNGGAFNYRPGGADVTAQTDWETYTDKRIIKLAGATLSPSQFNELHSRAFEKTNNSTWDKLILCGQGYYNKVSEYFENKIQWTSMRDNGYKGWDFQLAEHSSNSGKVYYKTHPLMRDSIWRNSAFIIDLGFLKWRPITDSDTDVFQNIQLPDADKRKDQYLTDAGPEIWFPEAHMFIDNLGGISK